VPRKCATPFPAPKWQKISRQCDFRYHNTSPSSCAIFHSRPPVYFSIPFHLLAMFISSTLVIIYLLIRPILEFVTSRQFLTLSNYPGVLLSIAAFSVALEFFKSVYAWGKIIQYNPQPESTLPVKVLGCCVLCTATTASYILFVSTFILHSTHKLLLWTFAKYYSQLVLFCYCLYRLYTIAQWVCEFAVKLKTAPTTVNKSTLKKVAAAAILFHCQMLLFETYSWGTIAMLCSFFGACSLCFDFLTNFTYILEYIISSNPILRSPLLYYCNICDRASSFLFKEKKHYQGYSGYLFV